MDMKKGRMVFSGIVFVALALIGCGGGTGDGTTSSQGCTEIGCGSALNIEFTRASWPAGKVDIVVDADGTTTNCSVTLPFASCDNLVTCDQGMTAFLIGTSGCALPAAQHSISGIEWPTNGPKQVTITVSQDGTMLGTKTFQPTYTTSEPNGPGCGPVCNQANAPQSMQL